MKHDLDLDALEQKWSVAFAVGDIVSTTLMREAKDTILQLVAELRDVSEMLESYQKRNREYAKRYRKGNTLAGHNIRRLVDATGSRRRLQALAVAGYTCVELAKKLQLDRANLKRIRAGDIGYVQRRTARRIARAHDLLVPHPRTDPIGRRTANWAAELGWLHSAAWDDIDNPADEPQGVPRPPRNPFPTS